MKFLLRWLGLPAAVLPEMKRRMEHAEASFAWHRNRCRWAPATRLLAAFLLVVSPAGPALAWGDEGHEITALIAAHYMQPEVRAKVDAMLAADEGNRLTAHDLASAATWADKFRESSPQAKEQTRQWHFVDIELSAPDEAAACFGCPVLAPGQAAFPGVAQDCVVDKIDAFAAELRDPATAAAERLLALKFVLHFVGDLHQPLHASDDKDAGGNKKLLSPPVGTSHNLHAFWDTAVVEALGRDPQRVADALAVRITPAQVAAWSVGGAVDWAQEAFALAKADAYGRLPPPDARGEYRLTPTYQAMASQDAAVQLSKAGVRLAVVLNRALGTSR